MKSSVVLLLMASMLPGSYRTATPGYTFQFPRDYFNHPDFRTEWWYYTGNLRTAKGRRFGFELTFFRHAVNPQVPAQSNVWDVRDVWMAHLALSDIEGKVFLNTERFNRSGPGLAGVDSAKALLWNGNWRVQWMPEQGQQKLQAVAEKFSLDLSLHSGKPPVIHGTDGISRKAEGVGRASHYLSLTRLETKGSITLDGTAYEVEGLSWMDHEFFTHSLESDQAGWDWFSLQFDDGSELMLYRLRRKDGSVEPMSSGTYIEQSGRSQFLPLSQIAMQPGRTWTSKGTKATYPIEWKIGVPSMSLTCSVATPLPEQELAGKYGTLPTYWEGAVDAECQRAGKPLRGHGYLEMTGYANPVRLD